MFVVSVLFRFVRVYSSPSTAACYHCVGARRAARFFVCAWREHVLACQSVDQLYIHMIGLFLYMKVYTLMCVYRLYRGQHCAACQRMLQSSFEIKSLNL